MLFGLWASAISYIEMNCEIIYTAEKYLDFPNVFHVWYFMVGSYLAVSLAFLTDLEFKNRER